MSTTEYAQRLISPRELATFYGVHPGTIKNWERTGLLTPLRIGAGKLVRYDLAEAMSAMQAGNAADGD
jgi:hypothetical protein